MDRKRSGASTSRMGNTAFGRGSRCLDLNSSRVLARAMPHRNVTLLRTESLINDGTAWSPRVWPSVSPWARSTSACLTSPGCPPDTSIEQERQLAETTATETEEALTAIPRLAAELGTDRGAVEVLRREYEELSAFLPPPPGRRPIGRLEADQNQVGVRGRYDSSSDWISSSVS